MTGDRPERLKLADVMLRRYLRLGESHTIAEVMGFLSDPHFKKEGLPFLVVIAEDGSFAGMLRPKAIFNCLLDDDREQEEDRFAERAASRLTITVAAIMDRDVPALPPGVPLDEAFLCIHQSATECVAVTEEGRVIGLITARLLFEKASSLTVGALSGGVIPPKP
ncbi:MAG: CBS domain-containing protein [Oceanipulchritudo sp.]